VRHLIQSVLDRWKTTSPKKEETNSDYNPNYDKYYKEYFKDIYKKENEWKRNLKKRLKSVPNTYNSKINNWTTGAISASNPTLSAINPASNSILVVNGNTNTVEVKTALMVDGRDILKELDEMRDALLLLKRDVDMETKYPRLKEIKDEYEKALEKYKTFEALK
jgi:hypothetical protein